MNPEQFQISARHSRYSMLPVENKVQGEKRHRLSFRPQEGHVLPTGTTRVATSSGL